MTTGAPESEQRARPSNDWKAALHVLGTAAAAKFNGNGTLSNNYDGDVLTLSSFIDAFRFAPQATFGILMATCAKENAFERKEQHPTDGWETTMPNADAVGNIINRTNQYRSLDEYEQHVRALRDGNFMAGFGARKNGTADDNHDNSLEENIVWILAGNIRGESIRLVEEGMRSRVRLYPKSRIILVDNDSPKGEAEKLRMLVEVIPGNHSYVRNPPPSSFEQGAYHAGLEQLMAEVPHPPENEHVVFTQATTVLLRQLPFGGKFFQPGCDIRPLYPPCCESLVTPPCDQSEQMEWIPKVNPFSWPDSCNELCPDGKCAIEFMNSFGAYKDRICGKRPAQGIMHASMITTGLSLIHI